ncbi:MAG: sigma-E factor negative regulatory protein [Caldimonas sp.]
MSTGSDDEGSPGRERLSALADGELDGAACAATCEGWRGADTRRTWHVYHLIGDVLRSDDLASTVRGDAAFLAAVRARLADEPVVLAPAPMVAPASARRRRSSWMLSSAVAAGFLLVIGAFTFSRQAAPPPGTRDVAIARNDAAVPPAVSIPPLVAPLAQTVSLSDTEETGPAVVADLKMIRDARLDRYLAAHKQFAGSSALGVPSTFLRSATVESGSR